MNLQSLDLNLLLALDAMLEERSVTRAARQMGLSQPAMSHALNRLRDWFEDELFVRSGATMVPTQRAEELAAPLRQLLDQLDQLLRPNHFEPATAELTLRIDTTDFVQFLILPRLVDRLRREAPGVRLYIRSYSGETRWDAARSGDVDISIGVYDKAEIPSDFYIQRLFTDNLVCAVRKGHPRVKQTLDLELYLQLNHVLVSPLGGQEGFVDRVLQQSGRERHIALWVQDFLCAPFVIAQSDYVITMPGRLARRFAQLLPLELYPAPIEIGQFEMDQAWHARTHDDPAKRWLRNIVAESCPSD